MNAAQFSSKFDFLQFSPSLAQALEKACQFEAAVYRADAYFQAEVAPRILHAGIVAAHIFIQAAIATVIFGIRVRRWYNAYNAASVPPMVEAPMLAISPAAPSLLLPAETTYHVGRAAAEDKAMRQLCKTLMIHAVEALPSLEVLIMPAPKTARKPKTESTGQPAPRGRKAAGIASQKAPARAKVGSKTACID